MTSGSNISGSTQRKIHAAIRQAVSAKLAQLDAPAGDRLLTKLDTVEKEVTAILAELSVEGPVLELVNDNISIEALGVHHPRTYFQNRKGLHVSNHFMDDVLSRAKVVEKLGPRSLRSYDLLKTPVHNGEITRALGKDYLFDVSELCARIEQMIEKQPNGERGDLCTDGAGNFFNIPNRVVIVTWINEAKHWSVDCFWHTGWQWTDGRFYSFNEI